jgi:hypothetical protein
MNHLPQCSRSSHFGSSIRRCPEMFSLLETGMIPETSVVNRDMQFDFTEQRTPSLGSSDHLALLSLSTFQ